MDLSRLLSSAYNLNDATKRCDDQHFNWLRKHEPTHNDARLQIVSVHLVLSSGGVRRVNANIVSLQPLVAMSLCKTIAK
jgi:hypothetical protein